MSDQPTPPAASGPDGPEKDKRKRSRSPLPKPLLQCIVAASETAGTAAKAIYAPALAKEGIDAAYLTALASRVDTANKLVAGVIGAQSDRSTTTDQEDKAKEQLQARIEDVQARAKGKYPTPGDPQRKKFYIGQPIARSRTQLLSAASAIVEALAEEPLAGVTPEIVAALKTALEAYRQVQTEQAGDEAEAGGARKKLDIEVELLKERRKKILYAVDAVWPSRDSANAPIRKEFKIPLNRPLA